jgi:hypothetical protein
MVTYVHGNKWLVFCWFDYRKSPSFLPERARAWVLGWLVGWFLVGIDTVCEFTHVAIMTLYGDGHIIRGFFAGRDVVKHSLCGKFSRKVVVVVYVVIRNDKYIYGDKGGCISGY